MRFTLTIQIVAVAIFSVVVQSAQAELVHQAVQPVLDEVSAVETEASTLVNADTSYEQRLALLESRISMIESHPASNTNRGRSTCPIPSTRISTKSIGCPSTYAGFDFAILQPNVGGLSIAIPPLNVAENVTSTFDYEVAPRVYIGHERADGLGLRVTYFQFDHKSDSSGLGVVTGLDLQLLDLEVTSRTKFYGSDVLLSAGFRYGKLQQDYRIQSLGSLGFESEGGGMTVGGQLNRALGCTRWNLMIGGRASILLTDNELSVPGVFSIVADESTMKIWEVKMGLSRNYQLACGANLVTEVALETQNWDAAPIAGLIGNDISLFGPTFRFGLDF